MKAARKRRPFFPPILRHSSSEQGCEAATFIRSDSMSHELIFQAAGDPERSMRLLVLKLLAVFLAVSTFFILFLLVPWWTGLREHSNITDTNWNIAMINFSIETAIQVSILLTIVLACVGLVTGIRLSSNSIDYFARENFTFISALLAFISALAIFISAANNMISTAPAYEVAGLVMALSTMSTFMGLGFYFGPRVGK
jgi:hypothetical protein